MTRTPLAHYEVAVASNTVTRYYYFGGQMIAMRQGSAQPIYLHTDALGSVVATSPVGGSTSAFQRYCGYGRLRSTGSGGTWNCGSAANLFATDRTYTGLQADGTGLMYYHARYYDPAAGQFISPDTLVPDPTNVMDYQRYAYARANPLNQIDPTGHETTKPEWWPDWLPYTLDLPDGLTLEAFDTWIAENNIYTAFGAQAWVNASLIPYAGGEASFALGYLLNVRSGDLVYTAYESVGTGTGTPDIGLGFHGGVTFVAGAGPGQNQKSLLGLSRYSAISGEFEVLSFEVGGTATVNTAINDLGDQGIVVPGNTYIDPFYQRSVDALSLNLGGGLDAISIPIQQPAIPADLKVSMGLQETVSTLSFNIYAPLRGLFSRHE